MTPPRNACIDFDNTLCDWNHPHPGHTWGNPILGAQLGMAHLRGMGLRLVVYTVKATTPEGTKAVEGWLRNNKIPYDEVTAIKPPAVVYLDDRAVRFTTWQAAIPAIRTSIREKP